MYKQHLLGVRSGTRSAELGYGSNRADNYYIAGGVVAGAVEVLPDFPEAVDDYAFLRDETGYSIDTAAKWIIVGKAADAITSEDAYVPVSGVMLDNSALSLAAGASGQLAATVAPVGATNKAVIFTSDNPEIAAVTGVIFDPSTGQQRNSSSNHAGTANNQGNQCIRRAALCRLHRHSNPGRCEGGAHRK